MVRLEARSRELVETELPEIKITWAHLVFPQCRGKLFSVVAEFGAARSQSRPDGGMQSLGTGLKVKSKAAYGFVKDPPDLAPPAAGRLSHHPVFGIVKHEA